MKAPSLHPWANPNLLWSTNCSWSSMNLQASFFFMFAHYRDCKAAFDYRIKELFSRGGWVAFRPLMQHGKQCSRKTEPLKCWAHFNFPIKFISGLVSQCFNNYRQNSRCAEPLLNISPAELELSEIVWPMIYNNISLAHNNIIKPRYACLLRNKA